MGDFTIEQLEAMKEKSPEGPWDWGYHEGREVIVDATGEPVLWAEASNSEAFLDVAAGAAHLLVAGLELLEALIAEKRAHQKLRDEMGELVEYLSIQEGNDRRSRFYVHGQHSAMELIKDILEAGNG